MVGKLGCGCCQTSNDPVPGGCTVCDATWSGYPADVLQYSDDFSSVDPGWRLLLHLIYYTHPTTPVGTVSPNALSDYLRNNRLHFFRSPFINFADFFTSTNRCIPPEPVPSTAEGRQPWLNVIRRANLYFPASRPRKYRFEVVVNYPLDSLPRIGDPDYRPFTGAVGVFAVGHASFYIFAQQLSVASDTNPNATLGVGIQLQNPPAFPQWSPTFEQGVTVPFGEVRLRFEYTYQPQTNQGTRSYYVNDVLQHEVTASGFFFSGTTGSDCVSACGTIVQLAAYEPWRQATSPPNSVFPLWSWNGYGWFRGGGNAVVPPPAFYTVSWLATNNPVNKLYFDDYAFDFVSP